MPPSAPATAGPSHPPAGGLVPPTRVWVTLASLAAATTLVRLGWLEVIAGDVIDQAVRNIITLILAFSGLMAVFIWFLRESRYRPTVKKGVTASLVALILLALAVLRIERVSGDLVPQFAFRWQARKDALLPSAATVARQATAPAGDWKAGPDDFPQFLGPNGTGSLPALAIDAAWASRPPRLLWRRPIGAGWSGFATCGEHAVTLEQRGDDEAITCYSIVDGEPEWVISVPARHETVLGGVGPRSTPTIADGVVYTTGATGWLHAIDGASGDILWRKDIINELGIDREAHAAAVAWGRSGSPLVTDQLVIVPAGGPRQAFSATATATTDPASAEFVSLVAFDRQTGEQAWLAGTEQIAYASPQLQRIAGQELVITVNEAHVAAYDVDTGREIWQFPWPGHSNSDASCSQAQLLPDNRLFVSKGYGVGAAVFALSATAADWAITPVWQQSNLLKTKFTNAVIHAGHAYGLSDGILECVRLADGKRAWKQGRYGQGQVLLVGDTLLVQAESGEVVAVPATPEKPKELGRLEALNGQTWNTLCLAGNRLLVRNAEEAACFELDVTLPTASDTAAEPAPGQTDTEGQPDEKDG